MVNEVNKNSQSGVYQTPTPNKAKQNSNAQNGVAPQSTPTKPASADSVNLTAQAHKMKALQDKAERASGFDQNKVSELKKAIAEGKYQVDSAKLAKNIANFEFDVYGQ